MALLTSCTRIVDDARVVAGPDLGKAPAAAGDASQCTEVDAPLTTVDTISDTEPVLKIPQPDGWERTTMLDSELIRFAMSNRSLARDDFAPTAVVTLEGARGSEEPSVVFEAQRMSLEAGFGATDLQITEGMVCGLPAETVRYVTPPMGNLSPHPAIVVCVVLQTDDMTYAAAVTLQTTDVDNPIYQRDSEAILTGFQMLQPTIS